MGSITTLPAGITCCIVLLFGAWTAKAQSAPGVFNVMNFGAVADGKTDNAKAFMSAWSQACAWTGKGKAKVFIPRGVYVAGPLSFKGPCKGPTVLQVKGVVKAPKDLLLSDSWITFDSINGFNIIGKGRFDGEGALAWNQCHMGGNCTFPVSLRFNAVTNAGVRGISTVDSKYFHIDVSNSKNVNFHDIKISSPVESLNTVGIHIGSSSGIQISRSVISTGDDCVSLSNGSNGISISGVSCGSGHGLSIGGLDQTVQDENVSGVSVTNCNFTGTENGIKIKTWPRASSGQVSNLTFQDIKMNNVGNPIVVDQQDCPSNNCGPFELPQLVEISNVIFKNIQGTYTAPKAVNLLCSIGVPCQGFELGDINLKYSGNKKPEASICFNAKAILSGQIFPATTCA